MFLVHEFDFSPVYKLLQTRHRLEKVGIHVTYILGKGNKLITNIESLN